jgi:hypothetical protein
MPKEADISPASTERARMCHPGAVLRLPIAECGAKSWEGGCDDCAHEYLLGFPRRLTA